MFRFEEPDTAPTPFNSVNTQVIAQAPSNQIQQTNAALPQVRAQVGSNSQTATAAAQNVVQQTAPSASQPFVSPRGVIPPCAACVQPAAPMVAATAIPPTQQAAAITSALQPTPTIQNSESGLNAPSSRAVVAPVSNISTGLVSQQGIPATQFTDSQGRVPTIYRLDMSDPGAFLVAQGFMVKNKDVIYVANASSIEFAKFLNIMVQVLYPIVNGKILIN